LSYNPIEPSKIYVNGPSNLKIYSKNKRPFSGSHSQQNTQKSYRHSKFEAATKEDKSKDKGKGIVEEFFKKLDDKGCFKCQGYGHFQADHPSS